MGTHYTIASESHYTLIVGWDSHLGTFYGQVYDKRQSPHPELGEAFPVLWFGVVKRLSTVSALLALLTPYGEVPLAIQAQLICDQALDYRPAAAAIADIVALAQEKKHQSLPVVAPDARARYCVLIDQDGWHFHRQEQLPPDPSALRAYFEHAIFGDSAEASEAACSHLFEHKGLEEALLAILCGTPEALAASRTVEYVQHYFSDPTLMLHIDDSGIRKKRPLYVYLPKKRLVLAGPIVITTTNCTGLTVYQVQQLQQELVFLDSEIRKPITDLYYHHPPALHLMTNTGTFPL